MAANALLPSDIAEVANAYGLSPTALQRYVQIESGGNPNATTGGYAGLLQLSPSEFARGGGTGDIRNPMDNLWAGAKNLADSQAAFTKKYGRRPTDTELYLTHQQGAGGFDAHYSNPSGLAWQNMLSTGEGKAKGEGWAKQAIWGNIPDDVKKQFPGGVDSVTSQQFMDLWNQKVSGGATPPNALGGTMPPATGSVRSYTPSMRGQLAGLMMNGSKDPSWERAVNFLLGSTGLQEGATGPSVADMTPLGILFGADEGKRAAMAGNPLGAVMGAAAMVPGLKVGEEVLAAGASATKNALTGAAPKLAPVEHDPFANWAQTINSAAEGGGQMGVIHVGSPIKTGEVTPKSVDSPGWAQDTYKTANGGEVEFMYSADGAPSHAVVWGPGDKYIGDYEPKDIYFPPKVQPKPALHAQGTPATSSGADDEGSWVTHATPDGGEAEYHFSPHGVPTHAQKWGPGEQFKVYNPDEVGFPPAPKTSPKAVATAEPITQSTLDDQWNNADPLHPGWSTYYNSMAAHEKSAISNYTSTGYHDINYALAKGHQLDGTMATHIKTLDDLLSRTQLPEDMTLYRGVSGHTAGLLRGVQPGEHFVHVPYASTSSNHKVAKDFMRDGGSLIEIRAPQGSNGLAVSPLSHVGWESEVILPRGSVLRMDEHDPETRTFKMSLVPAAPAKKEE